MALIQSLISQDKYSIKCPYIMTPKGICIHNTANDSSAINEIAYMKSNNNEVSYHIAIDSLEAIQAIPLDRNAWHAGDGGNGEGNRNYIAIEICYSLSGGEKFDQAEIRAAKEVAALLKQYGWTLENVKKHQDFSGKYCPHRTLDMGYQRFLDMIQAELNILSTEMYRVRKTWTDEVSQKGAFNDLANAKTLANSNSGYSVFDETGNAIYTKTIPPVPTPTPSTGVNVSVVGSEKITSQYYENGVFTCTESLIYFRNKIGIISTNPIVDRYVRYESVKYDYVVKTDKYVYISWVSESAKKRRYMPIREVSNGKYGALWGTIR